MYWIYLIFVLFAIGKVSAQETTKQGREDIIKYNFTPRTIILPDTTPGANFYYPTLFNWNYSTLPPLNEGIVGGIYFNNNFYFWNSTHLFLYDGGLSGPQNFIAQLSYQGSIRDMTTDGTWLYGSAASTTIHRMDANGISQGTITSGGGNVRAITYSPDENAFFVCDFFNNIGVINATTGALIRTLTGTSTLVAKYGMAYSTATQVPGGPFLWVWGQGSTADPNNKLWKLNPQTGTVLETYQFGPLPGSPLPIGVAGGAEIVEISGRWVLLLNFQNYTLCGYDLGFIYCPIGGPATNPNPAHGTTNVNINADLSWINPSGATSLEIFFGTTPGNLTSVYNGPLISTWDPGIMTYQTTYYWRVTEIAPECSIAGSTWSFTTEQNPIIWEYYDDFESGLANWTITNNGGTCVWQIFYPPYPNPYTLPATSSGGVLSADSDECGNGTTLLSTATFNIPINNIWGGVLEFDNDFRILDAQDEAHVEVSTDGGSSWESVWSVVGVDRRNTHEVVNLNAYSGISFLIRFRSIQPGWDWWWVIDNFLITGCLSCYPPFPPSSLNTSITNFNDVLLTWEDNSYNEYGFRVMRKSGNPNDPGNYILLSTAPPNIENAIDTTAETDSIYTYKIIAFNQYGTTESNTSTITVVPVPVELTLFDYEIKNNYVFLYWETASEKNNKGFEIERINDKQGEWKKIGFKEGYGTTTEKSTYSFKDKNISPGNYKYRLKQIDFDGSYNYSQEIEIELLSLEEFSLSQNYPNPFNPSTKIEFNLASGSKVTLKIFDILGQEVATIINGNLSAGVHSFDFDAYSLNSGVYFYTIEAKGVDGSNFTSTKKMILTK